MCAVVSYVLKQATFGRFHSTKMGNLTLDGNFRIAERAPLYFWSEQESQRLIVGCMQRKQERIKSMDFRTCT